MSDQYPWQSEYREWQRRREADPGPLREGLDLDRIADLDEWLSHPASWVRTELFVIQWSGLVPYLSRAHAWKMAPGSGDRKAMLEVILCERGRRKMKAQVVGTEDEVTE